jgi:uncharacterized protein (DUF2132 family)
VPDENPRDPLHGVTLKALLEALVERHGWAGLAARIKIACFTRDPSVKSSLTFLRATPWARAQVEALYVEDVQQAERNRRRNAQRAERRARAAAAGEGAAGGAPEGAEGETEPADEV